MVHGNGTIDGGVYSLNSKYEIEIPCLYS